MRWGDGLCVPARTPRKCRAHPHPLRPDPSLILASRGFPFPSSAHRPLPPRPCLEAGTLARLAPSGKAKRPPSAHEQGKNYLRYRFMKSGMVR